MYKNTVQNIKVSDKLNLRSFSNYQFDSKHPINVSMIPFRGSQGECSAGPQPNSDNTNDHFDSEGIIVVHISTNGYKQSNDEFKNNRHYCLIKENDLSDCSHYQNPHFEIYNKSTKETLDNDNLTSLYGKGLRYVGPFFNWFRSIRHTDYRDSIYIRVNQEQSSENKSSQALLNADIIEIPLKNDAKISPSCIQALNENSNFTDQVWDPKKLKNEADNIANTCRNIIDFDSFINKDNEFSSDKNHMIYAFKDAKEGVKAWTTSHQIIIDGNAVLTHASDLMNLDGGQGDWMLNDNKSPMITVANNLGITGYDEQDMSDMYTKISNVNDNSEERAQNALIDNISWIVTGDQIVLSSSYHGDNKSYSYTPTKLFAIKLDGLTVVDGYGKKLSNIRLNYDTLYLKNYTDNIDNNNNRDLVDTFNDYPVSVNNIMQFNFGDETDALDVAGRYSRITDSYLMSADDVVKTEADGVYFNNIDVMSGHAGSPIMLGQYGYNRGNYDVSVNNIWIRRIFHPHDWLDGGDMEKWDSVNGIISTHTDNLSGGWTQSNDEDFLSKNRDPILSKGDGNRTNHYNNITINNVHFFSIIN